MDAENYVLAKQLLDSLVQQNCDVAHYSLAVMYDRGLGCAENPSFAEYHYRVAANLNIENAKYYLAVFLHRQGELEQARVFYEEAAQLDNPSAAYRAYSLNSDIKNKINQEKAERYLLQAVQLGHIFAERDLALRDVENSKTFLEGVSARARLLFVKLKSIPGIVKNPEDFRRC